MSLRTCYQAMAENSRDYAREIREREIPALKKILEGCHERARKADAQAANYDRMAEREQELEKVLR